MILLYGLAAACVAVSIYCLWAQLARVPTFANSRAILNVTRGPKKRTRSLESLLLLWANKLGDFIVMDTYKRRSLEAMLESAGIGMKPEAYIAKALLTAFLTGLLAIPVYFIFSSLVPVILVLAIVVYFKEREKAMNIVEKRRNAIEKELLRFVSTIAQEVKRSNELVEILESYAATAMPVFKRELEILTVDMRTGNATVALQRFEARINSSKVNQVVKGLQIVLEGNDSQPYWENLGESLINQERQRLKREVLKRPGKVRKYSAIILVIFLATYLVIMVMDIMQSLEQILF